MPTPKIIDPSDPENLSRLLSRISSLEKKVAGVQTAHSRTKRKLDNLTSSQGQMLSNFRATATDAVTITWPDSWVQDRDGQKFQIAAGTATVASTANALTYIYNIVHKQLVVFSASGTSSLPDTTAKSSNITLFFGRISGIGAALPIPIGTIYVTGNNLTGY